MLSTFTVTGPGDEVDENDGQVTFCEAILEANASPDRDTIAFGISGVIAPGTALPPITSSVLIDATDSNDPEGVPLVTLDGIDAGPVVGLEVMAGASGSEIRGLSLIRAEFGPAILRHER